MLCECGQKLKQSDITCKSCDQMFEEELESYVEKIKDLEKKQLHTVLSRLYK